MEARRGDFMGRRRIGHKSIRELTVKRRSKKSKRIGESPLCHLPILQPPPPPPSRRPVHSSRLRESLVEQIGTNDRRKAVKAEFIYAFLP